MGNCISLDIPEIRDQLQHVTNDVMTGIHHVFPPDKYYDEDAIQFKKILKRRARGQLLRMCWDLTLMVTQGSIPYGSLRIAVLIF